MPGLTAPWPGQRPANRARRDGGDVSVRHLSDPGIMYGWLRMMRFELGIEPRIAVSTYSTVYKAKEKPAISDQASIGEEEFVLPLTDFAKRFAGARSTDGNR